MNNGGNMYDFRNDLNRQNYNNPYNNSNMNMNYNQQYMDTPKKKRGGGIIIILLLLIIAFLVAYIVHIKGIYKIPYMDKVDNFITSKLVKKTEEKKEEKKEEPKEEEITEEKTKDELINKVLYLSTLDAGPNKKTSIFAKDLKVEDLSDTQKIRIAAYGLNAIEDKYAVVTSEEELAIVFPGTAAEELVDIKSITATSVSNRYQGLFGKKPELKSITEGCPSFTYDSEKNKYYLNNKCNEETIGESIHLYAYKFSRDETHEYVYVAIGLSKEDETEVTLYSDYEGNNKLRTMTKEELESFQIGKSDYQDYSKYKFTFLKNESANYLFEKVEKVKEE